MKKILFPTDFSEISNNAFLYALKLADSIKAEIITLHVYDLPQLDYINVTANISEIYDIAELGNFENYKDQVPFLREIAEQNNLGKVKFTNVLEHGNLKDSISSIINSEQIDYVVMGTKGATGLKETFIGTNTIKIMNAAKAVVFAIPSDCKFQPIENILFLTKYNQKEEVVLEKVLEFASIFNSHITCLYVKALHLVKKVENIEIWNKMAKKHKISLMTIEGNDVEGIVLDYIKSNQIDAVAMSIHHKNFFEKLFETSLSRKLAFHVSIPILAIPE